MGRDFAFAHPLLLAGLAVLPLLIVLNGQWARRRRRSLAALTGLAATALLLRRRPSRLPGLLLGLGLVGLAVGMAGPRWGRDWTVSAAPGRDLVVVVDLSRSMFAEAPSRVELARMALLDLADSLRQRGGCRVGLVVFAGQARLVCPLTHDLDHFRDAVLALDAAVPDPELGAGTRIGAALALAVRSDLAGAGRSRAVRDILLLSDGDDPARDGEWRTGIDCARSEGVPISCVALGDSAEAHRIPAGKSWLAYDGKEVRTRREDTPLREIARRTGGQLFLAGSSYFPLGDVVLRLAVRGSQEESPDTLPVLCQRQIWFLLPAFLLLAVAMLLPETRGRTP